jgi:hypothetical protein
MAFCGNVLELVEKFKILEESENFIRWNEIEDVFDIEVYIEKELLTELQEKKELLIDIAIGEVNGEQIGFLFIKKKEDVYG